MPIEIIQSTVQYQAKTKLMELALETASVRNYKKLNSKIRLGFQIFLWLQALDYDDYLTKSTRDKITRCLVEIAEINDIPSAPYLGNIDPPAIHYGLPGADGAQGPTGPEGGGVPFSATGVTSDTICDTFAITDSRGVEYTINIYDDSGSDMRIMRLQGGWSSDGSTYGDDGGFGSTIQGDTSPVTMSIIVVGTEVRLFATVTSGTWTIEGTRKYVPNNGNGIVSPTTLASGKIWVGNSSNNPTAVTVSGDFTISNTGVGAITSGSIVNADLSGTAAVAMSKLASMTASKAVVTDSNGFLTTSSTTATQIGYLSNLTGDVQTALDSKISSASGAISTVTSTDLTASRALISNPSGKIAVSGVTSTELSVLDGITATTAELNTLDGITATTAELNYSSGLVGNIQDQLDAISGLNTTIVNIGDWNMQGGGFVSVAHGVADYTKIRSVSVMIINDSATELRPLVTVNYLTGASNGGSINAINSTTINLSAIVGGIYDDAAYNATSFNRGYLTITYTD